MKDFANPKIYLVTPPEPDLGGRFQKQLIKLLEEHEITCLRLRLSSEEETVLCKISDTLRKICHNYDVAIIIDQHMKLVHRFGLDGVHLNDGGQNVLRARKLLGKDLIVGAFCGVSRHAGMVAAEVGADYVSFGPVNRTNLGEDATAQTDLIKWWSQIIEVPVVAEGPFNGGCLPQIVQHADFLAFGNELWENDDPSACLETIIAAARTP